MTEQRAADFDAMRWGLVCYGEPKIVAGISDCDALAAQFKAGHTKEVKRTLEKRARKAVRFWLRCFGQTSRKRGRPRDPELWQKWRLAALAQDRGIPLDRLIPAVDRGGDKDAARDRLRKGIRKVNKVRRPSDPKHA
jgi:hypothetical protein